MQRGPMRTIRNCKMLETHASALIRYVTIQSDYKQIAEMEGCFLSAVMRR
jgi:hypothetical protein